MRWPTQAKPQHETNESKTSQPVIQPDEEGISRPETKIAKRTTTLHLNFYTKSYQSGVDMKSDSHSEEGDKDPIETTSTTKLPQFHPPQTRRRQRGPRQEGEKVSTSQPKNSNPPIQRQEATDIAKQSDPTTDETGRLYTTKLVDLTTIARWSRRSYYSNSQYDSSNPKGASGHFLFISKRDE